MTEVKKPAHNLCNNMCTLCCASVFVIGLAIPSLIIGIENEDDNCQQGTRGKINLSDWLQIFGFTIFI